MRSSIPRLVLDTNVLVSGLLRNEGPPGTILRALQKKKIMLIVSAASTDEFLRVLNYPKLKRLVQFSDEAVQAFVDLLGTQAEQIDPKQTLTISPDESDNRFLELAIESGANALVTDDKKDFYSSTPLKASPI